jgi:LysR family transcriptional regulator, positive regulator for ilvC
MEIRELELFLVVADLLHFGRASQICNLSPSALTRTIQRLENELGHPLFVRDNRTVQITPAGEKFTLYARNAVQDFHNLQRTLSGQQKLSGSLSIYASITAVYSILPDLVEAYRKAYADVQLELRTGAAEKAVAQVETGEIDIAVAALPDRRSSGINFLPLMTTELVFIATRTMAAELTLSQQNTLDLSRIPLVVPQGGLSRRRLDHWLKKNRVASNISSEVSGNEAIIPMVHLGCGVGVVPQLVLERSPFKEKVVVLKNAPKLDPYIVGLCSSRKTLQKPVVQAFWQLAENQLQE